MLMTPHMPSLGDVEGNEIPDGMPRIVDAHVHIFPDRLFSAVWRWFDEHGWRIRYQMPAPQILTYLLSRGVSHVVVFQYAHKPGLARRLNAYMAEMCSLHPGKATGMATVFPGEDNAVTILREAFDAGLCGLKLHAHVQCFDMNSNGMNKLYECCVQHQKPVVLHVGREPKSAAYACDPYELCSADKLEQVLKDFPDLKVCVPHLG
ncbi:amidohydrolase, partial [Desulfosarcina sp. OttesenSCG-928-A07]|nr:amidohydrolase [Desulfosarcina sp. OttesenSCG-928-A07]